MFTRILVPLDGSAQAERALPAAARLACTLNGTLILVRVAQPLGLETSLLLEHHEQITEYLAQVSQRTELAEVKHEEVALVGYPAEMILAAIRTHRADSVVLCSHGRTGLLRWALGSVAQHVVHHASVPVLLLPQQGPTLAQDTQCSLYALIPLDGSKLSETALEPTVMLMSALAPQGRRAIHLVEVVPCPAVQVAADTTPDLLARTNDAALQEAQVYLDRAAEQLRRHPLLQPLPQITWQVLADTDIAGALIRLAQSDLPVEHAGGSGHFDLIGMATHGRGGLQRLVMGSITERVISSARLPLLIIRPKEKGAIK